MTHFFFLLTFILTRTRAQTLGLPLRALVPLLESVRIATGHLRQVGFLSDVIGGVESALWEGCYPASALAHGVCVLVYV
jgi:hypothetical protein